PAQVCILVTKGSVTGFCGDFPRDLSSNLHMRSMRARGFIVACILSLTLFLFAARRQNASGAAPEFRGTVDLTHAMSQQTFARPVEIADKYVAGKKLSDEFVTYLEAPAHFTEGSWTVDQIPTERLIAPLVVIDISKEALRNPDYQLSMEDVAAWEREHG